MRGGVRSLPEGVLAVEDGEEGRLADQPMVQAEVRAGPPGGGQPGPEGVSGGPGPGRRAGVSGPLQVRGVGGQDEGALRGPGSCWDRAWGCTEVLPGAKRREEGARDTGGRAGGGLATAASAGAPPPGRLLGVVPVIPRPGPTRRVPMCLWLFYAGGTEARRGQGTRPGPRRQRAEAGLGLGSVSASSAPRRLAAGHPPRARAPRLWWAQAPGAGQSAPCRGQLQGPAGPSKCLGS